MTNAQEDYCIVKDAGRLIKNGTIGAYNGLETISPKLGKRTALGILAITALLGAYKFRPGQDSPTESNTRYHFSPVQERTIESNVKENGFPWLPVGAGAAGATALGLGALALRRRRNATTNIQPEISDTVEVNPNTYSRSA